MTILEELKQDEERARMMLERQVAKVVNRLRSMADQIEGEAKFAIRDAAEGVRDYHSYNRVAQQVVHEITWGTANTNLGTLIDTAAEAQKARAAYLAEDAAQKALAEGVPGATLDAMRQVLTDWIAGAKENHEAMGHRGESEPCWEQFHPQDIQNMINDAARQVGLPEKEVTKP